MMNNMTTITAASALQKAFHEAKYCWDFNGAHPDSGEHFLRAKYELLRGAARSFEGTPSKHLPDSERLIRAELILTTLWLEHGGFVPTETTLEQLEILAPWTQWVVRCHKAKRFRAETGELKRTMARLGEDFRDFSMLGSYPEHGQFWFTAFPGLKQEAGYPL